MSIMQRLYDREINAVVYSFWDCGFRMYLGDELNGYRAEGQCSTWGEVETLARRPGRCSSVPGKAVAGSRELSSARLL